MPKRTLGLDIGKHSIKATVVESTMRSFAVIDYFEKELEEDPFPMEAESPVRPDQELPGEPETEEIEESGQKPEPPASEAPLARILAEFIQEHEIQFDEVVTALPFGIASTRILEVPFATRKKIDLIIENELDEMVPYSIQNMVLDYEIIAQENGQSRILSAMVDRDKLRSYLEALALTGLDPRVVEVSSNSLFNLARQAVGDVVDRYALIDVGWKSTTLCLIEDGALAAQRVLLRGASDFPESPPEQESGEAGTADETGYADLVREIRQTLHRFETDTDRPVEKIYLCGGGSLGEGFRAALEKGLGISPTPLNPLDSGMERRIPASAQRQAVMAKSLGLALRPFSEGRRSQLNFRKGEFVFKRSVQQLRSKVRHLIVMGSILFVLLAAHGYTKYSIAHSRATEINDQISSIYAKVFPGQPALKPVDQFIANMEETRKKYRIIGGLGDGGLTALGILKEISDRTPKTIKLDVNKLEITQDVVKIEGQTDDFNSVDKIEIALSKAEGFKSIKKDQATKSVGDKIKFKFTISLTDRKAGD